MRKTVLLIVLAALAVFALAVCNSQAEPTQAPLPPKEPAAPVAPSPVATSTSLPAPKISTPVAATSTPTRVAPTATPVSDRPQYGGVLRHGGLIDVKSLDNVLTIGWAEAQLSFSIFDRLVAMAPDMIFKPGLAESWQMSNDGTVVTFRLRKGTKFQDGTPLNAQAVKAHFDRVQDPAVQSPARADFNQFVQSMRVDDEYTITFILKQPSRPFFSFLAFITGTGINSPTAVQKLGKGFAQNPVGAGPFKVKEWILDQRLVLERNQNYWQNGMPYIDQLVWLSVPDSSVQVAMLRTGELDIQTEIPATMVPLLEKSSNVKVIAFPSGNTYGIWMSVQKEPWNKLALRQALAYGVDRKSLIDILLNGQGSPNYAPEGNSFWWSKPDLAVYQYDPQKAKEKLAEAGFPSEITLDFWAAATASELGQAEVIQAMYKKSGIKLNIVPVPASNKWTMIVQKQIHMAIRNFTPRPDPDGRLRILFHSKGSINLQGYNSPEVDALMDKAATMYDQAEAKKLYDQIQEKLVRDVAGWLYTYLPIEFTGANTRVNGYIEYAHRRPIFTTAWLK
ncbi:MAG: hypothetical protein HYS60_00350 [Candidatus Wildermuthbacteria bacterium]|nr:hypothetical protein [Candidatus Wildermuthbacteria bacterium]